MSKEHFCRDESLSKSKYEEAIMLALTTHIAQIFDNKRSPDFVANRQRRQIMPDGKVIQYSLFGDIDMFVEDLVVASDYGLKQRSIDEKELKRLMDIYIIYPLSSPSSVHRTVTFHYEAKLLHYNPLQYWYHQRSSYGLYIINQNGEYNSQHLPGNGEI
jgi:hypothetical protein